jgi:hypothetical protein
MIPPLNPLNWAKPMKMNEQITTGYFIWIKIHYEECFARQSKLLCALSSSIRNRSFNPRGSV